ncbi:unnamed protein product [Clavelina lepadiformis]|uniref:Uncharacterized protein n=1 Tax=Clavelina lepadiformis TaxID=159417 RepID=A0ABP0H1P1_CLALP
MEDDQPTSSHRLISEERRDQQDSLSSESSTSRLLKGCEFTTKQVVEQGSVKDLHSAPSFHRFSNNAERHNTGSLARRTPSPAFGRSVTERGIIHSYSMDDVYHGMQGSHVEYHNSDVFLPPGIAHGNEVQRSSMDNQGPVHSRTPSAGGISYISRTSSIRSDITVIPLNQSPLAGNATRISRSSTRRSIGQEWTRHHWHKIKDLEEDSERARRCSKLSSGFAPLMIFGGLVFVCIGISAYTNTGKDKERLKQLSTAPLVMGIFMLVLGAVLISSWFGCRSRARKIDQKLLHGSRRNSLESDDNLVQAVVAKLYSQIGSNLPEYRNRPGTPIIHGVTIDGAVVHKTPKASRANRSENVNSSNSERCGQCQSSLVVGRETSV